MEIIDVKKSNICVPVDGSCFLHCIKYTLKEKLKG